MELPCSSIWTAKDWPDRRSHWESGGGEWHLLIFPWKDFMSSFMGHLFLLFQEKWLLIYFFKISCPDLASLRFFLKIYFASLAMGAVMNLGRKPFVNWKGNEENCCSVTTSQHLTLQQICLLQEESGLYTLASQWTPESMGNLSSALGFPPYWVLINLSKTCFSFCLNPQLDRQLIVVGLSVLMASSQIIIWRFIINYESLTYNIGLFLTSSYDLNWLIYINLHSIVWHYLSSMFYLLFLLHVFPDVSHVPRFFPIFFSFPRNPIYTFCLSIGHSAFLVNQSQYLHTL